MWCFNVPCRQHLIFFFPVNSRVACLHSLQDNFGLYGAESLKGARDLLWAAVVNWENRIISQDLKGFFQEWAHSGGSAKWARSSCRVKGTESVSHSLRKITFHKWKWCKWKIPLLSSREVVISPGLGLQRVLLSSHPFLLASTLGFDQLNGKATSAPPVIEKYWEDECARVPSFRTPWSSYWSSNSYCFKIKV